MAELIRTLEELSLPADVFNQAARYLDDFVRQCPDDAEMLADDPSARSFLKALATSDYFAQTIIRRPSIVGELRAFGAGDGWASLSRSTPFEPAILPISNPENGAQLEALRRLRHQQMVRILWRASGLCPVESSLVELSALADGLIKEAARLSHAHVAALYGEPVGPSGPDQLCVLAMGKLGGSELNMSSDVDLILTHSESGETTGPRTRSSAEFFSKQARVLTDLLASLTADGFCYRVDTRLRPFGSSGHPCVHITALENYLVTHGREWERYAYVKQRTLTGSLQQRTDLAGVLRPFVYRKYLDYGVFEELRSMKGMIDAEVQRNDLANDIKRGPGGIRELEFMVQTLQLVFGGKYPALQTPSFFTALRRLEELNYLDTASAQAMYNDYCFLRRVENGIQGMRDQQTHVLPDAPLDQQRLAVLLDMTTYAQLEERLQSVRARVQRQFDEVRVDGELISDSTMTSTQTFEHVEKHTALNSLQTLKSLRQRLEKVGRKRLDALMPRVVELLSAAPDAEDIAPRLASLLSGIGRRSAYFSLLIEHPAVLDRVVSICRNSPDLAAQIALSPVLLDTLADPRGSSLSLDRSGLSTRLEHRLDGILPDDEEQPLIALREFRKSAVFDVAVADMEQQLPVMKISDRLTDIAELVLHAALALACSDLERRYGVPRSSHGKGERARFAIVGYGKLGGIELGYGSDLDLVFLFDDDGEGMTDGDQSIDNSRYFAKLSRRLIQILTVPTRAGTLYEVDMRLRPSGRSGLLVSRLSAFCTYQRQSAWTWEHQALIRARAVAGDEALKTDFEAFRRQLLEEPRELDTLRGDVRDMRRKMKQQLDRSSPARFDLKQGDGGLVDLEFLVQYLVLAHAHDHPELARFSDNVRQLEAIEEASLLPPADAAALREAYLALRQTVHTLSLAGQTNLVDQGAFESERACIRSTLAAHRLAL